jgi:hypothetical protein
MLVYVSIFDRINAAKKPNTVMIPIKSCPSSNASGIIVSLSIASMAPAATAIVAAMTSGDNPLKMVYPQNDASPDIRVIPSQTPKM